MTVHFSKSDLPDIIDEFMAHLVWFREAFRERFFKPEVETYEQFKKGLIEEAIGKNIRTDVIDTLFREMERRYPELMRQPEPEQSPENPDSEPKPKPNPTSSGDPKPIPGPNTGKGKKLKRRGKKKNLLRRKSAWAAKKVRVTSHQATFQAPFVFRSSLALTLELVPAALIAMMENLSRHAAPIF